MHAVVLDQFGGLERPAYRETSESEIGPDEVLVLVCGG
jgi:NADPH:quinone reductase-like Zn-dependent oxidoreductase